MRGENIIRCSSETIADTMILLDVGGSDMIKLCGIKKINVKTCPCDNYYNLPLCVCVMVEPCISYGEASKSNRYDILQEIGIIQ